MTTPAVNIEVDRYHVSCLPMDHPDWAAYSLYVVFRRNLPGWVVTDGCVLLDRDGNRYWASVATQVQRARYTFATAEAALEVATALAPTLTSNGTLVGDVLAGMRGAL